MPSATWNSAASTDMNNTANYTAVWDATYDLVFNATSVFNSAATAPISCNSITITAAYTGTWSLSGQTLTCAQGFSDHGITGAHNYGNGITCNGASATVEFHSGSAVTATSCDVTLNGTTSMSFVDNKGIVFKSLTLGASAVVVVSGSGGPYFRSSSTPCVLGNGSTLTNNTTTNFQTSGAVALFSFLGTYTFNGTGQVQIQARNTTGATIPALTYTGSGAWTQYMGIAGNATITLTGNLNLGTANYTMSNTSSDTNTLTCGANNLTCGKLAVGAVSTCTIVLNLGSGSHTITSFDGTTTNPVYVTGGTTVNFQTCSLSCSGNIALGSNHTVNGGTSSVTITGNCTFTWGGKTMYDITVNGAATTTTQSGAAILHSLTVSAGSYTTGANNFTASGNLTFGGTNITLGANVTMTGSGGTIAITAAGVVTTTACTLILQNATTLNLGTRTISRLRCTGGYTYTFTAGSNVLTITNYTAGDWRQGTGTTTWRSSASGTQYRIAAPANTTVTNMDIRDCNNSAGVLINALDPSNRDSGNNVNILFGGAARKVSRSSIAIAIGY